jgi:Asp-tRNA(Asn)/Glu-tRNA(Gln) amidotransferase A subunit family amidase
MAKPQLRPYFSATPDFAAGAASPRDFLEACLDRIEALEPEVGAFVHLEIPAARAAADEAGKRWRDGTPLSPIDGMPVGIKDVIETEDMPTGQGSHLFTGYRGGRDAASVNALREAGAVILGKTVTVEFAAAQPRGTRNPLDLTRTPGGSSSGSGAAVGSGMLPVAMGTQVAGSILRPGSFCGCYAYKPSVGGINRGGAYDALSQSVHGPLAASLEDAWLTTRAISSRAGGDPGYPGVMGPMDPPAAAKPRTLAVLETEGWALASDAAKAALETALSRLSAGGVTLVTRKTSAAVEAVEAATVGALALGSNICTWEWRWPWNIYARRDRTKLSDIVLGRLRQAESWTQEHYLSLIEERARARAVWAGLAGECDAGITLSAIGCAPVGIETTGNPVFVAGGSLLGIPTMSMPMLEEQGLPLGLQIMGYQQKDAAMFATARWVRDQLTA